MTILPSAKAAAPAGGMDHARIAALALSGEEFVYTGADFYRFDERIGIWVKTPKERIAQRIEKTCRATATKADGGVLSGALKYAAAQSFREIQWDTTNPRDVAVQNGVLHYHDNTWELQPYKMEDYRRVSLPIVYNPNAKAPRFTQFIKEIFDGADDAKDRALSLMEMVGLTLTASTEFEKAMMLVGSGANGKSVMLRLLSDMLGEYVSGVNPAEFQNRFQRASLDGKLANIITELPEGTMLPDGAMKSIISGEPDTVERKHQAPFVMKPAAKIWIGTNHLPSTRDFSTALFRRFTILQFPNTFAESKRDVRLNEKLRGEIPGIINLALVALAQAFNRGYLSTPPSSEQAVAAWRRDADSVATFADEMMISEPHTRIASADAYSLYRQWAEDAGIYRLVNRNNLTRRLEALGLAQAGKAEHGQRVLFGIRQKRVGE